jgi:hypothetical protein
MGKIFYFLNPVRPDSTVINTINVIPLGSPLIILIGVHFLSLEINQLHDLSLFKNMMKKLPCSEINPFKNSDPIKIKNGRRKLEAVKGLRR